MAKRSAKKSGSGKSNDSMANAKAVVSLLIVMLAFGMYLIFNTYQDTILKTSYSTFMVLAIVGAGFLIGLLYLVNNPSKKR